MPSPWRPYRRWVRPRCAACWPSDPPSVAWARTSAARRGRCATWRGSGSGTPQLGISVLMARAAAVPAAAGRRPRGARRCSSASGDPAALVGAPTVALVGTRAPDPLRHRRGGPVRRRPGRGRGQRGVGSGAGHRRRGARRRVRRRRAAHRRRGRRSRRPLPAAARPAVGAGGRARGRRVGVTRRVCARRSGAFPSQPPAGGPERRRGRRGEPAPRRLAPHRRGRRGSGHPRGAVPGSIRSATSEGTNALLADGAFPVCSAGDILVALSLAGASVPAPATVGARSQPRRPEPGEDRRVYDALSPDPTSLDELARITGLNLPSLCGALERLARAGLAVDVGGWWKRE